MRDYDDYCDELDDKYYDKHCDDNDRRQWDNRLQQIAEDDYFKLTGKRWE